MKIIFFILLILSLSLFSYESNDICEGIYGMWFYRCKDESDILRNLTKFNVTDVDSKFQVCKKNCQELLEKCLKKVKNTN